MSALRPTDLVTYLRYRGEYVKSKCDEADGAAMLRAAGMLEEVLEAYQSYEMDLKNREHGVVAAHRCLEKIQDIIEK